jgi:hypothetical protein
MKRNKQKKKYFYSYEEFLKYCFPKETEDDYSNIMNRKETIEKIGAKMAREGLKNLSSIMK